MEAAANERRIPGARQVIRAIRTGKAARVYIALDAQTAVTLAIRQAADEAGIPVVEVESMAELGRFCRIQVGTSAAASLHAE